MTVVETVNYLQCLEVKCIHVFWDTYHIVWCSVHFILPCLITFLTCLWPPPILEHGIVTGCGFAFAGHDVWKSSPLILLFLSTEKCHTFQYLVINQNRLVHKVNK
jgi:hypothetical protein